MPNERILAGQIVSNRVNAGNRERDRQETVGENSSILWQRFVRDVIFSSFSGLSVAELVSHVSQSPGETIERIALSQGTQGEWTSGREQKRTRRRLARSHVEQFLSLGTQRLFHRVSTYSSILLPRLSCRRWIHAEARLFIDSWIERKPAGKLRFPRNG